MITNLAYWIAILAASCFAPLAGIELAFRLIPDDTDAMAGFYVPISVFALPITIPLCAVAIFLILYFAIVTPVKRMEETRKKYNIAIPGLLFGIIAACCGSLFGCMIRAAGN